MTAGIDYGTLGALHVLCNLCSTVLYTPPEREGITRLRDNRGLLTEPPFSTIAPEEAAAVCDLLAAADDEAALDELCHELLEDYTYLFRMVGQSRTSPYESVYRTDDHTLFGPTTLEVREAYRRHGFELATDHNEPDDHIALELEFLARLLAMAIETEDASHLATARAFASEHTLVFSPILLRNIAGQAHTDYYRSIARIASRTLDALSELLDAHAVESVPDPLDARHA